MGIFEQLWEATPEEALKIALGRFAKNRRFFESSPLKRFFAQPNKRLSIYVGGDGINIKEGDRLLHDSLLVHAQKLSCDPLNRYHAVRIANLEAADNPNSPYTAEGINAIIEIARNDRDFTEDSVHFDMTSPLPVVVFYGVRNGLCIEMLQDRLKNGAILYESDPEWFVISCYFLDYERLLAKSMLIVSGRVDEKAITRFLAANMIVNSFLRLELTLADDPLTRDAKLAIGAAHSQLLRGWGTAEDEMIGVRNTLKNRDLPFLYNSKRQNFPIAVAGSGPSLNGLLDFLREESSRLIIFSCGTALKPLLSAGIRPDFQIEIERTAFLAAVLKEAPLGGIPLIAAAVVSPETIRSAESAFVFARDSSAAAALTSGCEIARFSSPVVGNAALALALKFSSRIYLCGLDAGFRRNAKRHAENSFYDDRGDSAGYAMPTRGNFSADIWTTPLLAQSRSVMEMALAAYDGEVFNLSDGAFIKGTKPLKDIRRVMTSGADKESVIDGIKAAFRRGDFVAKNALRLREQADEMVGRLKNRASATRAELFEAVSSAVSESRLSAEELILRGSFWHLLHALLKSLMAVGRSDISDLYERMILEMERTLRAIAASFDQ
ncbi:MAG: DUF115 domain-containing protein [Helicobacteraceae bacterium]|jgi:hypothetical protein|nr:DUF115 domain-containing protein [Helicobacteraceae bacterium]